MKYTSEDEFALEMKKLQSKNKQIEMRNKLKAEKNKHKPQRKEPKTSNRVLIFIILAIVSFTIACLYIQYVTGVEVSSTLTTLWFSFWTVEIVALTGIKVAKIINNGSPDVEDVRQVEDDDETEGMG